MLYLLSMVATIMWIIYLWNMLGWRLPRLRFKSRWQREAARPVALAVDDPREAAAGLIVALAEAGGAPDDAQKAVILREIAGLYATSAGEAEELFVAASFILRRTGDPQAMVMLMAPLAEAQEKSARHALIAALQKVNDAAPTPNEMRQRLLTVLRQRLG